MPSFAFLAPQRALRHRSKAHIARTLVLFAVVLAIVIALLAVLSALQSPGGVNDDELNRAFGDSKVNPKDWMYEKFHELPSPEKCRNIIKGFVRRSWDSYVEHAWGFDELQPMTGTGINWYSSGSMGLMIVDSLDTLLLVGMHDEANRAIEFIEKSLDFSKITDRVSFFELTISVVGGLLSAYEISGRESLLHKATELADKLIDSATDNGARRIPRPYPFLNPNKVRGAAQWVSDHVQKRYTSIVVLASVQLEFRTLSYLTGDAKYDRAARQWAAIVMGQCHGRCALGYDEEGKAAGGRSAGLVKGDSYYEYLLKQYLLTNQTERKFLVAWFEAVGAFNKDSISEPLYVPDFHGTKGAIHHLSCFYSGALALSGSSTGVREHLRTADLVLRTCRSLEHRHSRLPRERVPIPEDDEAVLAFVPSKEDRQYRLRPEIVESLFYLYRATHDEAYRKEAWQLLASIYEHLWVADRRVFTSAADVTTNPVQLSNRLETFWVAETLKYLWLIFSDDDVVPLEKYVLSTEAHIFPIQSSRNAVRTSKSAP